MVQTAVFVYYIEYVKFLHTKLAIHTNVNAYESAVVGLVFASLALSTECMKYKEKKELKMAATHSEQSRSEQSSTKQRLSNYSPFSLIHTRCATSANKTECMSALLL